MFGLCGFLDDESVPVIFNIAGSVGLLIVRAIDVIFYCIDILYYNKIFFVK